jgi:hypothetical protein
MDPRNDLMSETQDQREWDLSDTELDRTTGSGLDFCTCLHTCLATSH